MRDTATEPGKFPEIMVWVVSFPSKPQKVDDRILLFAVSTLISPRGARRRQLGWCEGAEPKHRVCTRRMSANSDQETVSVTGHAKHKPPKKSGPGKLLTRNERLRMSLLGRIQELVPAERVIPNHRRVSPRLIVLQDRVIVDPRNRVVQDGVLPRQEEIEHRSPRLPRRH